MLFKSRENIAFVFRSYFSRIIFFVSRWHSWFSIFTVLCSNGDTSPASKRQFSSVIFATNSTVQNPFWDGNNLCVAARSEEWNALAEILGSRVRIPLATWMSVRFSSMFVLSCVVAMWQDWSPAQGVLPAVYKIRSSRFILMRIRPHGLTGKV